MAGAGELPLRDEAGDLRVVRSEVVLRGAVWDVRRDEVDLGDGQTVVRELIAHPGAVGIVALDDEEQVLLVRQYRHPVRSYLWEPPAGLLDVPGEPALETAQRELYEEAHVRADDWHVLVDFYNSPGSSAESFRCFLARGVRPADGDRHAGEGEERDMPTRWVPLDDLAAAVARGDLHNPTTVTGVLATLAARAAGWTTLRPPDAPWPERSPER
jgi:ADP-ribose pyrophosphatase